MTLAGGAGMSWWMPVRRGLNVVYAALVEGLPPDLRRQVDDTLAGDGFAVSAAPTTGRSAALARESLAFAMRNGGEWS